MSLSVSSKVKGIYANKIQLTSVNNTDVDIVCDTGDVLINGVKPSNGGGSGILPPDVDGIGNITTHGNIRAQGDGVSTGQLEGVIVKATSGNIIASLGDIIATSGNITAQGNGTSTGKMECMNMTATSGNITANLGNVKLLAGDVEIDGAGSLFVNGTGEIKTVGGGNITAGLNGNVETTAGDIVSAGDMIFEGDDIYRRTNDPVATQSYVAYKQLAQLNAANTFTGANKFDSNINEFSKTVSVGERAVGGVFTQNLALNTSGNLDSKTINNSTTIQCGDINCGNFTTNAVRAKKFISRTTEHNLIEGWTIEQEIPVPGVPSPLDKVLQVKGGEVGATLTIVDNAFSGSVPNIELDPRTTTNGGKITTTQYNVGEGTSGFLITQPKVGVNSENLLIMSGNGVNPKVVFDDYGSTTTLMTLEKETGTNDGFLKVPAIEFGIGTLHNKIYQLQSGATNLNLNIKQATASSEVVFQDNVDDEIIRIRKGAVELKANIEFHFGSYNFVPQQYSLTNPSFPIESVEGAFTKIFTSASSFTNVNTGVGGASLTEGFYKLSVSQTGASSPSGSYENLGILCDFVYRIPTDALPNNQLPNPLSFSYKQYLTAGAPEIEIRRSAGGAQDVHLTFPTSGTGGESMAITVKLTRMDF